MSDFFVQNVILKFTFCSALSIICPSFLQSVLTTVPVSMTGLSTQSDPDAVGEPHHGHPGVTGSGHRAADRRAARTEAVRTNKAAHLSHDDEEHQCTRCLPTGRHPSAPLCW